MVNYIDNTLALAHKQKEYHDFRSEFYAHHLVSNIIADSRETVPVALACFLLANGDAVKTILYVRVFQLC